VADFDISGQIEMLSMEGKTAVVTGAGQGIGREIALFLSELGCDIAVIDVNGRSAEETATLVDENGVNGLALSCDVGDIGQVEDCVARILEWRDRIDFLVNNAGITRDNLLLRMKEEEWESVIRVNLTGTYHFTKAVSKHMLKKRSGKIVNISSVIGSMGNAGQSNYAASKAGVVGFTKAVAREVAGRNITVNAVSPGFVETPMTDVLTDVQRESMARHIPLGRFGTGRDIASVVIFLLSELGDYITGQVINCDGGMLMS